MVLVRSVKLFGRLYEVCIDNSPDTAYDIKRARRLVKHRKEKIHIKSYTKAVADSVCYKLKVDGVVRIACYINEVCDEFPIVSCLLSKTKSHGLIVLFDYLLIDTYRFLRVYQHGNIPIGVLSVVSKAKLIGFTNTSRPYIDISRRWFSGNKSSMLNYYKKRMKVV